MALLRRAVFAPFVALFFLHLLECAPFSVALEDATAPVVTADTVVQWMILVRDRTGESAPNVELYRTAVEASGATFVRARVSSRSAMALWFFDASANQMDAFLSDPHSPDPARYSMTLSESGGPVGYSRYVEESRDDRVRGESARWSSAIASASVLTSSSPPWGLDRIDQRHLPLDGASYSTGGYLGTGVRVYVVDTGVSAAHPHLVGRVVQAYTAFPGDHEDRNGHGTHVAGIIVGSVYGVARNATVYSYRVLDENGSGTTGTLGDGLFQLYEDVEPPAVINLSLEYSSFDSTVDVILRAILEISVGCAAAGNSGSNTEPYPSATDGMLSIGSSTAGDERSYFSNYGSWVSLFAPGSSITSDWNDNSTRTISGTSMACAFASGVAALYWSRYPSRTPAQVRSGIVSGATSSALKATSLGSGSPNLLLFARASDSSSSPPPPPPLASITSNAAAPSHSASAMILALSMAFVPIVSLSFSR